MAFILNFDLIGVNTASAIGIAGVSTLLIGRWIYVNSALRQQTETTSEKAMLVKGLNKKTELETQILNPILREEVKQKPDMLELFSLKSSKKQVSG